MIPIDAGCPLLWATAAQGSQSDSLALVDRLDRQMRRKRPSEKQLAQQLEQWLCGAEKEKDEPVYALACLAWCHALPRLADILPAAPWWQLHEHLLSTAGDASAVDLEDRPLLHQLLAGELPLTLAHLFGELASCRALAGAAGRSLSTGIQQLLDGNGMIAGDRLPLLRPLLACWTRAGYLGRAIRGEVLDETAQNQFEWAVRQAIRLTRYDGSQILSHDDDRKCGKLFEAALKLAGDADDRAIAAVALPRQKNAPVDKRRAKKKLPKPASHSEWAETAVLRTDWSRSAEHLTVSYTGRSLRAELNCGAQTLFSGSWNPQVKVDGRLLQPQDDWEEVCWNSDDDVDYLELEMTLDRGWKIQRQFLLARTDRFLLVGDAVLGADPGRIEYGGTLPLRDDVDFTPAEESNEGVLRGSRGSALVVPLALPEWRVDRCDGSLAADPQGLTLSLSRPARRLYAPLFFDLHPRRRKARLTWRRLTVGEQLEIQKDDVAVGYRVQVGDRQWLIYRSLAPRGNRSLLGQNFSSEFFAGRFDRDGETQDLLEIE